MAKIKRSDFKRGKRTKQVSLEEAKISPLLNFRDRVGDIKYVQMPNDLIVGGASSNFNSNLSVYGKINIDPVKTTRFDEKLGIGGRLQLSEETSPSAPASGLGGKIYVKSDGLLYYISSTVTETNIVPSLGNGWNDTGTDVVLITSSDNVGIGSDSPVARLEVGSGHSSTLALENILIACDGGDDSALDLIEETGDSSGFGTSNAYGFRFVYDGGDNKLYIKSGVGATTTTRMTFVRSTGNVGIGTDSPSDYADLTLEGGALALKETTTPTADTNYGKIYTKSDNKLYFQDGAGTEYEVSLI